MQVSNPGGLMRRSKVILIALKSLSVLLTGSPAALWPPPPPQHLLLPVSRHAFCNRTLVLSPFLDYFSSSWDFFFFFLHPERRQLCRKKGLVYTNSTSCRSLCSLQLHALKPALLLLACLLVFFVCVFKVSHSLETQDWEPTQLNAMETAVVVIWEPASQGH